MPTEKLLELEPSHSFKQLAKLRAMKSPSFVVILLLLMMCLGVTGCVNVAPWERGILAKPHMAITQDPVQNKARAHNYSSREAGAPVNASGSGGGCGCY